MCRKRANGVAERSGEGVSEAEVSTRTSVRTEDADEREWVCCVSLSLSNAIMLWVSGSM